MAENKNLTIWETYADIDPKFTKPITGKDYRGTSPNPQYVVKCMTDLFGPVGKGFGWRVVAEGFQPFGDTVLHWCRIVLWWRDAEGVHEVEEYGQTKAAYQTSGDKYRVDEDAPKKSLTDAIVKGCSHIGIAANIFLGRWDDQKYVQAVNAEYREEEKKEAAGQPSVTFEGAMKVVMAAKDLVALKKAEDGIAVRLSEKKLTQDEANQLTAIIRGKEREFSRGAA